MSLKNPGEDYHAEIRRHYQRVWRGEPNLIEPTRGKVRELPSEFRVLEYPRNDHRNAWVYATVGMSLVGEMHQVEIHVFSQTRRAELPDLLGMIAHFHRTGETLGVNHTVNLGFPWLPESICDCALLSPPYLDGQEMVRVEGALLTAATKFLWVVPLTAAERVFARQNGAEPLWDRFEDAKINHMDTRRRSVV